MKESDKKILIFSVVIGMGILVLVCMPDKRIAYPNSIVVVSTMGQTVYEYGHDGYWILFNENRMRYDSVRASKAWIRVPLIQVHMTYFYSGKQALEFEGRPFEYDRIVFPLSAPYDNRMLFYSGDKLVCIAEGVSRSKGVLEHLDTVLNNKLSY